MKILGIIAEFNPFHNGHKYFIDTCIKKTGADFCIIAMSGNFVQRGTPAIINSRQRAQMALEAGASVCLEMDSYTSTGSAEYFASGAVELLTALGCVDYLAFGSEEGKIEPLLELSKILTTEDKHYRDILRNNLSDGLTYPAAREKALSEYLGREIETIRYPNNILAIEYLKAIENVGSNMKPVTIERVDEGYNSDYLTYKYSSAKALRQRIENSYREGCKEIPEELKGSLPKNVFNILSQNWKRGLPVVTDDFSSELIYALTMNYERLEEFFDIPSDIAERIRALTDEYQNFTQFTELIKTKNRTYNSVSRALLHILLGMKKKRTEAVKYAKIIGFRKDANECISMMSKKSSVPLIFRNSDIYKSSDREIAYLYNEENRRERLYANVLARKFMCHFENPAKLKILRV